MIEAPILPKEIQDTLNATARSIEKPEHAKKIFVGLPNMCTMNVGLVTKLFAWAQQRQYDPWFHFITEKRPIDYARNILAQVFMQSPCDFLLSVDDDIDPHPALITMADLNKDIIAGNAHCWINGELMPSIWQRAECEQCMVVAEFQDKGTNKDPSQYRIDGDVLARWNPFRNTYQPFYDRGGKGFHKAKCRCKGTGWDPFVFRTHQQVIGEAGLMQVDSVGAATMMVARRVFEKSPGPHYKFLYKESSEIMLTEDHYFCWQALENGFEIWAQPQLVCSHFKTVDLWGVQQAIIRAFNLGMAHQKRLDESKSSIVVPSEAEMASVLKM